MTEQLIKIGGPTGMLVLALVLVVKESYIALRRKNSVSLEDVKTVASRTEAKVFEMEQRQREGCIGMLAKQQTIAERQTELLQSIDTHLQVIRNKGA